MTSDFRQHLTRLSPEDFDEACERGAIEDLADHHMRCEWEEEQVTDSSGNVFADLGLEDAHALLAEAVRHLRAWVAWCDGPADPHPLDSLQEAKAFLERLDGEGGQS